MNQINSKIKQIIDDLESKRKKTIILHTVAKALFATLFIFLMEVTNGAFLELVLAIFTEEFGWAIFLGFFMSRVGYSQIQISIMMAIILIGGVIAIWINYYDLIANNEFPTLYLITISLIWATSLNQKVIKHTSNLVVNVFPAAKTKLGKLSLPYLILFCITTLVYFIILFNNGAPDIVFNSLVLSYTYTFILFMLEVIVSFIFKKAGITSSGFKKQFKEQIITNYLKDAMPNVKYDSNKGILQSSFEKSCLLATSYAEYSSEDYLKGTHLGLPVVVSEVRTNEGEIHDGLMLIAKLPKNTNSYCVFSSAKHGGNVFINRLKKAKTDISYFKDNYRTYTNNYSLSEKLLNKSFSLDIKNFNRSHPFVSFSIVDQCIHIAIEKEGDLLEGDLYKKVSLDLVQQDLKYYHACFAFLELLKKHIYTQRKLLKAS